jgi:hypothetical protein
MPCQAVARAKRFLEFLPADKAHLRALSATRGRRLFLLLSTPFRPTTKAPDTGQKSPDCFLLRGSGFNHSGESPVRIAPSMAAASIAILAGFAFPVSATPSSLNSHAGANAQVPESEPSSAGCHAYQKNAEGAWVEMTCYEGSEPAPSPVHSKSAHHHSGRETSSQ